MELVHFNPEMVLQAKYMKRSFYATGD